MSANGPFGVTIDSSEVSRNLQASISRAYEGTRRAAIQVAEEILAMSLAEVPEQTSTLAGSGSYKVEAHGDEFTITLGYGLNGDPINPNTGKAASEYMVQVHEDLTAYHPKGKAKFLEDPVNEYQQRLLGDVAAHINTELG